MDIKRIVKDNEKSLRKVCAPVKEPYSKEDIETALYLHEYLIFAAKEENQKLYNLKAGVGLAAPQIGINKRMLSVYIPYEGEDESEDYVVEYALINPKIISHTERKAYLLGGEGCLSVDGIHEGFVPRYAVITIEGYDCLTKQNITIKLRGYDAIVMQHELDHLDGILFYDRINKENPYKKIEGALEI